MADVCATRNTFREKERMKWKRLTKFVHLARHQNAITLITTYCV